MLKSYDILQFFINSSVSPYADFFVCRHMYMKQWTAAYEYNTWHLSPTMCRRLQVACTWEDVKSLRADMDRSTAEGKVHFRGKLLQAVATLQVRRWDGLKVKSLVIP